MPTTEISSYDVQSEEMEIEVGEKVKRYRVNKLELDQASLAARAGVSVRTLRNLEMGGGTSLRSYLRVIHAMGRYPWLQAVIPSVAEPVIIVQQPKLRQRVHKPRGKKNVPS